MTRYLPLFLLLPAFGALAAEIDLSPIISQGKYELSSKRSFKIFGISSKNEGTSDTCIDGNPRTVILNWLASKHCTVHQEEMKDGLYHLRGQCKLKVWPSPIPAQVTIAPKTKTTFTIDIHAEVKGLASADEHTVARLAGACEAPGTKAQSTTQSSQDQGGQDQGTSGK